MGCGDSAKSSTPIQDAARQAVAQQINPRKTYDMLWGSDPVKQPMPYSGDMGGAQRANLLAVPSPAPPLPTVKVFRPIAPPLPQATVTLTLTETQAQHLKALLGCIGTGDNAPVVSGWSWTVRPAIHDLRASTDAIYYALSNAKV